MAENGFDVGVDERGITETVYESKQVIALLEKVDKKYKDVIIMRYIDELSIKEIAFATGETENNISVRIHRGLEKVRGLYTDETKQYGTI